MTYDENPLPRLRAEQATPKAYNERVNRAAANAMEVIRAEFAHEQECTKVLLQGRAVLRLYQGFYQLVEAGALKEQARRESDRGPFPA